MTHYREPQAAGKSLRAVISVAAAICVLGLASLLFIHAPDVALVADVTTSAAAEATRASASAAPGAGWTTNVPSADSVFRGKGSIAPEEPIAQF